MRTDSTVPQKINTAERRAIVVDMRKDGFTVREIARFLGISHNAVHKHENKALAVLADKQDDATRNYRTLQVQRLEAQHKRLTKIVTDPEEQVAVRLQAEATLLKLDERISKKYGTDAAILIKSESSVTQDLTPEQEARLIGRITRTAERDGTSDNA